VPAGVEEALVMERATTTLVTQYWRNTAAQRVEKLSSRVRGSRVEEEAMDPAVREEERNGEGMTNW